MTTGSSAAFNLAFLAMFDVGDRVAIAAPGYPAYRNILAALGIEVVEIEIDGAGHLTAGHVAAAHRRKAAEGRAVCQSGQSDRGGHPGRRSRGLVATARDLGIAGDLRRDLSSPCLRRAGHDGAFVQRRRDGHQLLLEILLHDRLADRLDGAAGNAGAAGRAHRSRASTSRRRSFRRSPRSQPSRRPRNWRS